MTLRNYDVFGTTAYFEEDKTLGSLPLEVKSKRKRERDREKECVRRQSIIISRI